MSYTPDGWVLLKMNEPEVFYKVFGFWRGGYTTSDSWRLNSGVVSVTEDEDYFYFKGESGSVYQCHKGAYGDIGSYGAKIVDTFAKNLDSRIEPFYDIPDIMSIDYFEQSGERSE